ncbi:MAG: hypothetical protein ACO1OO_12505 [Flavisolibacter sp.]
MKPLLLLGTLIFCLQASAQSGDYLSVRKKNGRVVKNFMPGTHILLQTKEGRYWEGPIKSIKNDSITLTIYEVRLLGTTWNSVIRDTFSVMPLRLHYIDIARIYMPRHRGFFERQTAPLLMIAGAGYTLLNLANGATYGLPLTDKKNLGKLSVGAGLFAAGWLLRKVFQPQDYTTNRHRIEYVNLTDPPML